MTPAAVSPRFSRWFGGVVERRLADTFAEVRVHGRARFEALAKRQSVILVSNHSSWWDPMMSLWCKRLTGVDSYALMNGLNLAAHGYFSRVGAIGVDLDDPRDGARFLRYGRELLNHSPRALWVFAQGREVPAFERPLKFLPGAAALARLTPSAVCMPVALSYVFAARERPVAYMSFGEPLPAQRDVALATQAQIEAVHGELDRIEEDQRHGMPANSATFERHLVHQPGYVDRLAPRLLSRWMQAPKGAPAALGATPGKAR